MPVLGPDLTLPFDLGYGRAAERLYRRLEPLAYDDPEQGYTLRNLTVGITAPVEIGEIARDSSTHIAWSKLRDPDYVPAELLDWLAVDQGIVMPPSAITETDKRYRIKQAAGRYRGTPRALAEEIQLTLTDTKTVLLGYQNGDEWHYLVGTRASETPDPAAVEAAIVRQNPAFMLWDRVLTTNWSSFVLAPTLIAARDAAGNYTIGQSEYPTCQSVLDSFNTCQDLLDNNPI